MLTEEVVQTSTTQEDTYRPKYAGFWIRFWAYLVDLLMVTALGWLVVKPVFRFAGWTIENPSFLFFTPFKLTMLAVFFLYFVLMTKFLGQTLGKMMFGIRVESQKEGKKLSWGDVIFREVIGRFISKYTWLPYLFVIFMPKREALHDVFADTVVVHENTFEKKPQLREPQLPPTYVKQVETM